MLVSGVRSSCETSETNCDLSRSTSFMALMSYSTETMLVTARVSSVSGVAVSATS